MTEEFFEEHPLRFEFVLRHGFGLDFERRFQVLVPKRGDLLLGRGMHPHPDRHGGRIVVAEKFTRQFSRICKGPGCQNANGAIRYLIELRKGLEEVVAGNAYLRRLIIFHSVCNRLRERIKGACGGKASVPVRSLS